MPFVSSGLEGGQVIQGIPDAIYTDNGPIARSRIFQNVLECLGVKLMTHIPAGKDGRRTTARSKGKVERPFRTVKEAHETLYHFHKPENEAVANLWLHRYIASYNGHDHRSEPHSRLEDWMKNLPEAGIREMCAWERFCAFAREPERRLVGGDARLSIEGVVYEVDPVLAGENVVLWWGLFDQDLYVEFGDQRFGPFSPIGGPIPLHRYRKYQKTKIEERADRVAELAARLGLPRATLDGAGSPTAAGAVREPVKRRFVDPDPFHEMAYTSVLAAKLAIADELATPLARLSADDRAFVTDLVSTTLEKKTVLAKVRERFKSRRGGV